MKSLFIKLVVNALAIWLASRIVTGIDLADGSSTGTKLKTLLFVALIFGVVNAIIKPVVKLFSLPLFILTLGLITFVINALMLWLTEWLSNKMDLDFHIDGFWTALLGALVISLVSWFLSLILDRD
ncbi:phage holin family protein [Streptomyces sp. SID3343]|uniref:phage holin family protein n=1 Tax=Streptomyces sp. SID3343 TaxID=2690260 RepID=UPI00136C7268|nr:phage holin family protein [Streptomyces sp. SID3343]MYW04264.1 phage holin family protein [Streptomyces sp. SID3343]